MTGRVFYCLLCLRGGLLLNEFMPRPQGAEGEWVELLNSGDSVEDLSGVVFGDGSGRSYSLPGVPDLAPGDYLVLAQKPDSLRARFHLPDHVRVLRPSGWPILNDNNGAAGYADVLVLRGPEGVVLDSLAYGSDWLPTTAGRSVERGDPGSVSTDAGSWGWSVDPSGGTPGSRNSLGDVDGMAPGSPVFTAPYRVQPTRRSVQFVFSLPAPGSLGFWLVDAEGRHEETLKEPAWSPARGRFIWSQQTPPRFRGPCFVCLRWTEGTRVIQHCRPIWIE